MADDIEEMAVEQAKDLSRLEGMAAEAEPKDVRGGGGVEEVEIQAPAVDAVESLAGMLAMAGAMAGGLGYRRVAGVWAEPKCQAVAAAAVPVLRKYPWGGRIVEFLEGGTGAEEVALFMVAAPMVMATVKAAREDTQELDMVPTEHGEGRAVANAGGGKPDGQVAEVRKSEPVEWVNEN